MAVYRQTCRPRPPRPLRQRKTYHSFEISRELLVHTLRVVSAPAASSSRTEWRCPCEHQRMNTFDRVGVEKIYHRFFFKDGKFGRSVVGAVKPSSTYPPHARQQALHPALLTKTKASIYTNHASRLVEAASPEEIGRDLSGNGAKNVSPSTPRGREASGRDASWTEGSLSGWHSPALSLPVMSMR